MKALQQKELERERAWGQPKAKWSKWHKLAASAALVLALGCGNKGNPKNDGGVDTARDALLTISDSKENAPETSSDSRADLNSNVDSADDRYADAGQDSVMAGGLDAANESMVDGGVNDAPIASIDSRAAAEDSREDRYPQVDGADDKYTNGSQDRGMEAGLDAANRMDAADGSLVDMGDGSETGVNCAESLNLIGNAVTSQLGTEVTLSWKTNLPATSYLSWREYPDGVRSEFFEKDLKTAHQVTVGEKDGMEAGKTFTLYASSTVNCPGMNNIIHVYPPLLNIPSPSSADAGIADGCAGPLVIENLNIVVSPFGNEATVSWNTDWPAVSYVSWWDTSGNWSQTAYERDVKKTAHKFTIDDGIVPGKTFGFRVYSMLVCPGEPNKYSDYAGWEFQTNDKPHLLIVLSPKYSNDGGIDSAIGAYSKAIAEENWVTDVLKLNQTINDHAFVKAVLAERKKNNNTLAAILVGQDLPFNYNSSSWFICPALRDWMEIERASPPMPANVLGWFENIDMSISLLMPDQSDDPPTRTSAGDVSQAFLKFANDRKKVYPSEVAVFHNPQLVGGDQLHAPDYPELRMLGGNLTVNGNTTQADLDALGKKSLKLFALLGHGTPDNIEATPLIPLTARELGNIDVPLAILDGCHTYCWYNFTGKLSSTGDFFGNNVLSNFSQRAVVAGMPVWVEVEPDPPNFLSHAVPILARGKSLAQAVYGSSSMHGDGNEVFYTVIYGDITFHY